MKIVTIGDGGSGKTCLLISHWLKKFPEEYVPTSLDNLCLQVNFKDKNYELGIFDTAGGVGVYF